MNFCIIFRRILPKNERLPKLKESAFLVSARKAPKEADLKGAELLAPASKAVNYGAIATGNRPILIRCAEHHPFKETPARTYGGAGAP